MALSHEVRTKLKSCGCPDCHCDKLHQHCGDDQCAKLAALPASVLSQINWAALVELLKSVPSIIAAIEKIFTPVAPAPKT